MPFAWDKAAKPAPRFSQAELAAELAKFEQLTAHLDVADNGSS